MFEDFYPLDLSAAVDARNENVRASSLVLLDFFANALSLAESVRFALDWGVMAYLIVVLHVGIRQDCCAPQLVVVADEFDVFELLLYLLLD